MVISAYPVKGKQKSRDICAAFLQPFGARSEIVTEGPLREGPAFFYGVDASNQHYWHEAKKRGDYYYCDNSYFDTARQEYFRITYDALQHDGSGESDGSRFESLDLQVQPWRPAGKHLVICPQSDYFMQAVVQYPGNWMGQVRAVLAEATSRPLRLRLWSPNKTALAATLHEDLEGAHMLITFSSAAAITALLAGVPIYCDVQCAAACFSAFDFNDIEKPPRPEGRKEWAQVLADNQWTLDEMRKGIAWESLNKNHR